MEDKFRTSFADGQFGAMMQVHIQNDGPVTLDIESPNLKALLNDQEKQSQNDAESER